MPCVEKPLDQMEFPHTFCAICQTPPSFVVQSYKDWYDALTFKAAKNVRLDIHNDYQDISVMGMVTNGLPNWSINNWACSSESAEEVL